MTLPFGNLIVFAIKNYELGAKLMNGLIVIKCQARQTNDLYFDVESYIASNRILHCN